jgi:cysteine desulfurase
MIYADYNGSAPLLPQVIEYLGGRLQQGPYANPNAIHSLGQKMYFGLEKCRSTCAKALGADAKQVIFNSGSSEGITHVFHSVLDDKDLNKNVIITSGIEHSAVVQACDYYAEKGFEIVKIKCLENGVTDIEDFKKQLSANKDQLALVTIMAANNETGVIQPWQEISELCNEAEVPFFSDTTQYIGKTDFNFKESGMDYAVISGHKVGAMIGSGFLLVKDPTKLKPLVFGGGQEFGKRGGTQNYIGAETLAVALDHFDKNKDELKKVQQLREAFESNIKKEFPEAVIIGENAPRLASTTMIAYPGVHGQAVQIELESNDIFVTTSSACSDNEPETSKVLRAMGIHDDIGRGVVRISLCLEADQSKYAKIEEALKTAYKKLSKIKY